MKRIEQTHVFIEMLQCSDTFEQRLGKAHVARLAESIKAHGLIHPPVVRASDMQVIAGEDRIAAHVLLNADEVLCDLVECSDAEVEALRAEENDKRRSPAEVKALVDSLVEESVEVATDGPLSNAWVMDPIPAEWLREADERIEQEGLLSGDSDYQSSGNDALLEMSAEDDLISSSVQAAEHKPPHDGAGTTVALLPQPSPVKRGRGRPKGSKGKAIEEAAKQLGTTPNAVRKKIARVDPEGDAPPWESWGREKPEIQAEAAKAYRQISRAYNNVIASMRQVTDMQKTTVLPDDVTGKIWDRLKEVADMMKAKRPTMLCAWCKGVPKVQKTCAACNGMGYLSSDCIIHRELKDSAVVMMFGKRTVDDDLGL